MDTPQPTEEVEHDRGITSEIFCMCDEAEVPEGRMTIHRTFNTFILTTVPSKSNAFTVAGLLRFEITEQGQHKVRLSLVDDDHREVVMTPAELDVDVKIAPGGVYLWWPFRAPVPALTFQHYGDYSFVIEVDGDQIAALPFGVNPVP